MCFGHVAGEQPRVDVVAGADADADHEANILALVEVGDVLRRQLGSGGKQKRQRQQQFSHIPFIPELPPAFADLVQILLHRS